MLTPGTFSNCPINCPARPPQLMNPRLISSFALAARSEWPGKTDVTVRAAAAEQINQLLVQGVVEKDGGDITSVASLSNGLLTVNSKTVPLTMFAQEQR